jgi:hypothetical protein
MALWSVGCCPVTPRQVSIELNDTIKSSEVRNTLQIHVLAVDEQHYAAMKEWNLYSYWNDPMDKHYLDVRAPGHGRIYDDFGLDDAKNPVRGMGIGPTYDQEAFWRNQDPNFKYLVALAKPITTDDPKQTGTLVGNSPWCIFLSLEQCHWEPGAEIKLLLTEKGWVCQTPQKN